MNDQEERERLEDEEYARQAEIDELLEKEE
jgi:hypothetical protein